MIVSGGIIIDMKSPTPKMNYLTDTVFARMYPGVAVNQEGARMIVSGGRLGPTVALDDVLSIDCSTGGWEVLDLKLPTGRWRHISVVLGQYLVVVGGCGVKGARNDVLAVDLISGEWLESVVLADSVHSGSAVVWGDKVIYTGGWSSQ